MKKIMIILLLGVFGIVAHAQLPEINLPGYGITPVHYPAYDARLQDTITNMGTTSSQFYINHISKDSMGVILEEKKKIFFSDDSFVMYIYRQGHSTDPDERRLEYIRACARFYKNSQYFRNGLNIAGAWKSTNQDSATAKIETLNGSNASHRNKQCGEYATYTMWVLYKIYQRGWDTVACNPDLYRSIGLDGHSIFEPFFHGKWVFVDVDPGTPGFMFPDGLGSYWSTQDLVDSPSRAVANWNLKNERGEYYRGVTFENWDSLSKEYQEHYFRHTGPAKYATLFSQKLQYFLIEPTPVSGDIILPPQGMMGLTYQNDVLTMKVDSSSRIVLDSLLYLFFNWDDGLTDSLELFNFIERRFEIPRDSIPNIFQSNGFLAFEKYWYPQIDKFDKTDSVDPLLVEFQISSGDSGIIIGKDFKAPFSIVDVVTDNPITIGDVSITGTFHFDLWGPSMSGGPDNWDYKNLNYLTSGYIPPHTTCRIKCAYNPGWIQWWNGYSIDQLGRLDTLQLTRSTIQFKNETTTGLSLPVKLIDFTAVPRQDYIKLSWKTAMELDNNHFEVLRCQDALHFEKIGSVSGSGTTTTTQVYEFLDYNVVSDTIYYYQIRQVDHNGSFTDSSIRSAMIEGGIPSTTKYFSLLGQEVDQNSEDVKIRIQGIGTNHVIRSLVR